MKKTNILIVHPIKEFSGSLKSLEQYLLLLKKKYNFFFLVPSGQASKRLKKYGKVIKVIGLSKFDNTQLGFYRNIRWLLLIRELLFLLPTVYSLILIKKKIKKIDIIHFNEITLLPTIVIFRLFFKVPFILHSRILFKKDNFFGRKIVHYFKKNINQIIAIDNDVKNSFPKNLDIKIVRNIFIFNKKKIKRRNVDGDLIIGYLGSFLKYKGIEELIYVFNKLIKKNYKIKLILAGNFIKSNFFLNATKLSNNIDKNLIRSPNIKILGHLDKLEKFYNSIDLLCFPSHLNALGRQVIEAGFFEIPSLVCLKKNKSDSFINNETGLGFKRSGSLKELEKKIKYFYNNKKKLVIMGRKANLLVSKNFDVKENCKKLEEIYLNSLK